MTTPLIEAIARAMADEMKSNLVFVSDDLRSCLIDGGLFDLHDVVKAALTAITEAGYWIAPNDPTEAMLSAASEVQGFATISAYLDEAHLLPSGAGDIYRAMKQAEQGDG